ncbi:hypothetical protein A2483_04330 [Candidatus Peregrinibacteria bacterium RIFOXYC2_FULL_33_13]|nr:MAG: hypothetical protein UR27_C0001G0009 [Candidatus Peregrinibacteria bacterium GW2011_GWA2_33_10]KKP39740.1 MAG: hypothetical protein UR30_C0008G0009 [Candidatus Peregrinibacteria bacterium GW2011_GWC2_33_13]OGJ50429.1 MAG: hypothetical protein A2229_02400 [Candidatus Peregrinibacteria bacterium RIFOXYA2_FULL_33_7]OGJ55683.1 MAG: hypothetical protein A2483_04330 [Candidatus Peregrinibacteria bacterium RIFOXYC2_FULL_33_13]
MQFDTIYIIKLVSVIFLASLPAIIWFDLFSYIKKNDEQARKLAKVAFILGCFSVLVTLGIQHLWSIHPEFNLEVGLMKKIANVTLSTIAITFMFATFEETAKLGMIVVLHKFIAKLQTINQVVFLSMASALGFAFIENIFFFIESVLKNNFVDLFFIFTFRSLITVCAHVVFTGIFGYYFALAIFSESFFAQTKWEGKKYPFITFFNKIFKIKGANIFKQKQILTGFLIATSLHTLFNIFLQKDFLTETLLLVIFGFLYILYLMKHKVGYLMLGTETLKKSLMAKNDEDVIIELLGMWLNEEKYAEVEEVCDRLLKRDPDNKVVQLFKAKAHEKKKFKKAMHYLKGLFSDNLKDENFEESLFEKLKKERDEKKSDIKDQRSGI